MLESCSVKHFFGNINIPKASVVRETLPTYSAKTTFEEILISIRAPKYHGSMSRQEQLSLHITYHWLLLLTNIR